MGDTITAEDATQQLHEAETELRQLHRVSPRQIHTEMGVVQEIYCENFMCHRKLRVTLSPHINFITGENGSGKSAIVAAIQICLGASARSTHRGKSIKNLIRHGHEGNALVRITLRNDAVDSDAFRPEQFGRKIQVERLIRRDGSAEYRLKDERGIVVSKLKADLDAMLDHLNIQTDNPCGILDQDNAKLFLKGTPEDKYKFFLQATDLEKMSWTYAKIDEVTRNIAKSTLMNERANISTLKTAMNQAKKQWTKAKNVQHLEEEVEMLQKELTWSVVEKKEAEIAKMDKKIEQKKRDAEHVTGKYDETKEAFDNLEKKQKKKNDKVDEDHTRWRWNKNSVSKSEVQNQICEARRSLRKGKAELKQLTQAKQRSNQRLSRLQHDLQKKREDHEAMLHNRMQRNHELRESIEMKRREVHDAGNEVNEAKDRSHARPQELDEVENRHDNCVRQLREADGEAGKTQHRKNQLKSQKRDSLAVFGNRIPQLQQLIQQNRHRFSAPPIGPLGLHVKLPERFKHFAVAIEVALKGTLASYLVVDGRDKALLDDLKRQIHCPQNQANIIISQRNGYRYGNLRLAEGNLAAHAICNILEVDNDEVFNALLDVCEMENKL
ncbi:Structural maintenance of chromosomes protein, partial [Phytophthora megakarya]